MISRSTVLFGNFSGTNKWAGGVLAPNGKIYFVPREATQILELDPNTKETTLFGNFSGINKWYGGVLAPNGKIYFVPFEATQILELDPNTKETTLFGNFSGTSKWYGGVLAPNGKIYFVPFEATQILELDPNTKETTLFGNFSGTSKWLGGVLAPNGKIYFVPREATQILELSINDTQEISIETSKYYFVRTELNMSNTNNILSSARNVKIRFTQSGSNAVSKTLQAGLNVLYGSALATENKIYIDYPQLFFGNYNGTVNETLIETYFPNMFRGNNTNPINCTIDIDNTQVINLTAMGELPQPLKQFFAPSNITRWDQLATTSNITAANGHVMPGNDWLNILIPYGEGTYTAEFTAYSNYFMTRVIQEYSQDTNSYVLRTGHELDRAQMFAYMLPALATKMRDRIVVDFATNSCNAVHGNVYFTATPGELLYNKVNRGKNLVLTCSTATVEVLSEDSTTIRFRLTSGGSTVTTGLHIINVEEHF